MKICVQGLWHLGTVIVAGSASLGHDVIGLDFDESVINNLRNGQAPIHEPGLDDLLLDGLSKKLIHFTEMASDIPGDTDVLWVTYDTPVDADDKADADFVYNQIIQTLPFLPNGVIVMISSQLPVGSIAHLEEIARKEFAAKELTFACSPENLRLGRALDVFLHPDRIVVGYRSAKDKEKLQKLFHPWSSPIEWMSVESAEMTKHAINSFLAVSVTYANEIASICELVGADAKEVERGLKSEQRIGPGAYLSPGGAFAGGTLARDIAFLNQLSLRLGLESSLLASVRKSNENHKHWVERRLKAIFPSLHKLKVAVWGLTYKPETDTLRRSAVVEFCSRLINDQVQLRVHDPLVKELPEGWEEKVERYSDPLDMLRAADVLIVGTAHSSYKSITPEEIKNVARGLVILDQNRILKDLMGHVELRYYSVGTSQTLVGSG